MFEITQDLGFIKKPESGFYTVIGNSFVIVSALEHSNIGENFLKYIFHFEYEDPEKFAEAFRNSCLSALLQIDNNNITIAEIGSKSPRVLITQTDEKNFVKVGKIDYLIESIKPFLLVDFGQNNYQYKCTFKVSGIAMNEKILHVDCLQEYFNSYILI